MVKNCSCDIGFELWPPSRLTAPARAITMWTNTLQPLLPQQLKDKRTARIALCVFLHGLRLSGTTLTYPSTGDAVHEVQEFQCCFTCRATCDVDLGVASAPVPEWGAPETCTVFTCSVVSSVCNPFLFPGQRFPGS